MCIGLITLSPNCVEQCTHSVQFALCIFLLNFLCSRKREGEMSVFVRFSSFSELISGYYNNQRE